MRADRTVVRSLLDQDQYKFTMQQAVLHNYPATTARYAFTCRDAGKKLGYLAPAVREQVDALGGLSFSRDELDFLSDLRFIKADYVDFLRFFRLDPAKVLVEDVHGDLRIIIEGSWLHTILFEVPVLSIVSHLYAQSQGLDDAFVWDESKKRLIEKMTLVRQDAPASFRFAEFGTRRRLSYEWQHYAVGVLMELAPSHLVGTSNVGIARDYGITPIGTMAHEWIMAGQGLERVRLRMSQKHQLEVWAQEYRGDLGYALTDTITMDAFLSDFDLYLAKLYDGLRLDSGDPAISAEKAIRHYESLRIDPRTKYVVPSDALDFRRAIALHNQFSSRVGISFGIGGHITNDSPADKLSIVIKMTHCNGQPVCKISDTPEKATCPDKLHLAYAASVFGVEGVGLPQPVAV